MQILKVINGVILNKYYNLRDFRTKRKIVVFESDDWGAIRVPSRHVWEQLLSEGYAMDKRPYERYDTLETNEDVEALFDVLLKYKDSRGNHPVITANYLSQNPDFDRIRANGFSEYVGESILDTYKNYPSSDKVVELMKQGIDEGLIMPQCHGREHLNVRMWMKELQRGDRDILKAFDVKMPGIFPKDNPNQGNKCVIALGQESVEEQQGINQVIVDALKQFETIWGFKSKTFVACNYTWSFPVEKVLKNNDVQLIQTDRFQRIPLGNSRIRHFSGEAGNNGLLYSIRNCHFEPSEREADQNLQNIITGINTTLNQHKIAVVSTHRMNYVSSLDGNNRVRTLQLLDNLLKWLTTNYPNIEFISSDKLTEIING